MNQDFYKKEAQRVISNVDTSDPSSVKMWIQGATEKMLKQDAEISSLKFQSSLLIFFVFIMPIIAAVLGWTPKS